MAGSALLALLLSVFVTASTAVIYQCGASYEAGGNVIKVTRGLSYANCQIGCDNNKKCQFFMVKEKIDDTKNFVCIWMGAPSGAGGRNGNVIMICAKLKAWPKLRVPLDFTTNRGYVAPLAPGKTGAYKMVAYSTGGIAIHATMVPNTNLILTYGRPQDPKIPPQPGMAIANAPNVEWPSSLVDTARGIYWAVKSNIGGPFCAHTIHLYNGDILSCGGDDNYIGKPGNGNWGGARGCRYFTMENGGKWIPKKNLVGRHWYPTMIEMPPHVGGSHETCALIMGGFVGGNADDLPTTHVEVMCPYANKVIATPVGQASPDKEVLRALTIKYPISFLLPIGAPPQPPHILLLHDIGGTVQRVNIDFHADALSFTTIKTLPYITEPDLTFAIPSGAVMLALDLSKPIVPEFVVFGGSHWRGNPYGARTSWRIKPLADNPQWEVELMPEPAVMRPGVILPNGKIALVNGARKGQSGGGPTCCYSNAKEPIVQVWLYSPNQPKGKRYWVDPVIAPHIRMYHNEAWVGIDGTLQIIAGDQDVQPNNRPGFTLESWTPPALRLAIARKTRPSVKWLPKQVKYGAVFKVMYAGPITRCSLVKPMSNTHSMHMNERVLILKTVAGPYKGAIKLKAPDSSYIAPPGWWILYCFKGDVWSTGHWMRLEL